MRNIIIAVVIVALLGLGYFVFFAGKNNNNSSTSTSSNSSTSDSTEPAQDKVTVTYGNGFSPTSAVLKSGGTVTWVNKSGSQIQIGVDPHPTHTGDKAITGGEFTLDLNDKESKAITVTKTGTFSYHNHLESDKTGTIIVK